MAEMVRCGWVRGHTMCSWFTDDPYGLCEEHKECSTCRAFPCEEDCLGPRIYLCQRCGWEFHRHQVSRVGAAQLCRSCARDPMGDLR